ncbi:MAG: hypothetical protein A2X45_00845 [Lentisphaerae bacterium GWF2_50_93]|nr:MAG: hypothetical protein A2X45_00845 [Lentisphaerae bacterium GWF2_50_93]
MGDGMSDSKKTSDNELKVFISSRESKCGECGHSLGFHAWIVLKEDKGALCLTCADMDHLVFLPSGDMALTRRSKKHSRLSAVVLKWSRSRRRYERQGLLVENEALEKAEKECDADAGQREIRQAQSAIRSNELDKKYLNDFSARIRELFPNCPKGREKEIAAHACRKYSGRVGRSANAKELDGEAVKLAVIAHIRHVETDYDKLLSGMLEKSEARRIVYEKVGQVLKAWGSGGGNHELATDLHRL